MERRNSMSKTAIAIVMLTILFSAVAGLIPSTAGAYTHTPFAEDATATW
jgi:hypothetical protein